MHQIFGLRELDIELDFAPRLIIDGGAHVGYSTLFFANKYPEAMIISVEPDASNCDLLIQNCKSYTQVKLIRGALWPRKSSLAIRNPEAFHDAFQVGEIGDQTTRPVQGYTLPELMEAFGSGRVDILKLDIEGAEKDLFAYGHEEWLPRVRTLMIELHDRFRAGRSETVLAAAKIRNHSTYQKGEYKVFRFNSLFSFAFEFVSLI